ncbi:MAG: hypothetical protein ACYTG7_11720 [Planctomycetota bacterium]
MFLRMPSLFSFFLSQRAWCWSRFLKREGKYGCDLSKFTRSWYKEAAARWAVSNKHAFSFNPLEQSFDIALPLMRKAMSKTF